jgi:RHS repeat-associated protein
MWGNDLSGSLQGAGGVGGLLMLNISGTNCFTAYDGNGNITALINATDKSLAARYEYSPYGELLRATGLLAHQNPFRFSTKFLDDESGLIYYGYRYYGSRIGKWLNRDPKDESGGNNLYLFLCNSPIHLLDPDGQKSKGFAFWAALGESIMQFGLLATGHDMSKGASVTVAMNDLKASIEKGNRQALKLNGGVSGGGTGGGPPEGMYFHEGEMKISATKMLALGAIGEVVYITSGQADKDAATFAQDAMDFAKHSASGDGAWADLDAAMIAIDMINLTGNDNFGLSAWAGLESVGQ